MKENEEVPEIEKLSHHEFDLDVEEQERLQAEGEAEVQRVSGHMIIIILQYDHLYKFPTFWVIFLQTFVQFSAGKQNIHVGCWTFLDPRGERAGEPG